MSELVRFHDWIFDRNEINYASIENHGIIYESEFDQIKHTVIVKLKNGEKFILNCASFYDAKTELNFLTSKCDPVLLGRQNNTYYLQQLYFCRNAINNLTNQINKLMNSYKKVKKKETKNKD